MLIIVTGCSGFLGSVLCKTLISLDYKVKGIDIVPTDNIDIDFKQLDLTNVSIEKLRELYGNSDVMIHCAASVPITRKNLYGHLLTNSVGTAKVVATRPKRMIYISTSAVYGSPNGILTERSKHIPIEEYGVSKSIAEMVVRQLSSIGSEYFIIRPRTIIGRTRMGMMDILYNRVHKDKNVPLLGKGDNKFQLLSLDDCISGIIKCIDSKNVNEDYNLGTDGYTTLRQDLEHFIHNVTSDSKVVSYSKTLGQKTLQILDKLNLSPMTSWHYDTIFNNFAFDTTKAKELLGWKPMWSNVDMLIEGYYSYLYEKHTGGSPHKSKLKRSIIDLIP
jgi:nucleoside-diphosphate-sugar epimerase